MALSKLSVLLIRCGLAMQEKRVERLQIMLSPEELLLIDDFRFRHRMPTRTAAVRELMRLGLASNALDGDGQKSANYGLFARSADGHRDPEAGSDATG